jgi:hypothetical protein
MKIKAMNIFNGLDQFFSFTEFLEVNEWRIEKQLLKDRVNDYKNWEYFLLLRKKFSDNQISIWDLKDEEVITWLDTLLLLRRIFTVLLKKGIKIDNILTIMEYPLVNGNYMRSDYLIVYDRLIFVLEFGMFNQDEKRSEERYTKKLQESINYRQIIANQVAKEIQVINYVMIYKPEYDKLKKQNMVENISYNEKEILKLSKYLMNCLTNQQNISAIKQLEIIEIANT